MLAVLFAALGFYFRRPLGVCVARVRRLPEIYQRLRGRYEAPEEETEMLTGGGDYHRNGDLRDDEERMEGFDDSAFPVQRRSLNGSCAFECVLNAFGVVVYATLQHRQTSDRYT